VSRNQQKVAALYNSFGNVHSVGQEGD